MSLEKAIAAGKERRKPYFRSGRFDRTCRPGGSCPYCQGNRFRHKQKKLDAVASEQCKVTLEESE